LPRDDGSKEGGERVSDVIMIVQDVLKQGTTAGG